MSITELLERIEALSPAKRARAEAYVEFLSHEEPADAAEDDPTGWKMIQSLKGCITDTPPGESIGRDHDRYLYRS